MERGEVAELRRQVGELLVENGRQRGELAATQDLVRLMAGEADVQAVLEAVTLLTGRLIGTGGAAVHLLEGERLRAKANVAERGGRRWLLSLDAGVGRRRPVDAADEPWELVELPERMANELAGAPLDPGWVAARAVLERRTVAVSDLFGPEGDEFPVSRETSGGARARGAAGYASIVSTPLVRGGRALGVLSALSTAAHEFTAGEIALLETFAGQAALAIENARLLAELQDRLEQQTATAEVLRVIAGASAAGDESGLRDAMWRVADALVRLTGADEASVFWRSGGATVLREGMVRDGRRRRSDTFIAHGADDEDPARHMTNVGRRARYERRPVQVADLAALTPENGFGGYQEQWVIAVREREGFRAVLGVPLMRGEADGGVLEGGVLELKWRAPHESGAGEIAVVQSFADQAVIAIENARLFAELQERLEEQTATAEVLRVISGSPGEVLPVLRAIVAAAARLFAGTDVLIHRLIGDEVEIAAHEGPIPANVGTRSPIGAMRHVVGYRAMLERRAVHVADLWGDAGNDYPSSQRAARQQGTRAILAVPLVHQGQAAGALILRRAALRAFTAREIALAQSFADQAAIAIENARLFSELNEANSTLKAALEQQTATAEVLRIIASSPEDLQSVLDALTQRAAVLTGAERVVMYRGDRHSVRAVARGGLAPTREPTLVLGSVVPDRPVPGWVIGRAMLSRAAVSVDDAQVADDLPVTMELARRFNYRSLACVPLLREGEAIGAFALMRFEVRPFSAAEVALLESFADQAVIALENARLFGELRERDERRRQELERAASIQQRLLPSSVEGWPGVLELAVRFRPAVETSGDFYDVLALAPAQPGGLPPLQLAVGDVAGKGMSAALVTALARSALRSSASIPTRAVTPAGTLRVAGSRLHEDVGGGHFVACALAVVEPPGRHNAGPLLRLANAAQVPVLLVRGGEAREVEPPGYRLPLGAEDDGAYEDVRVELRAGDAVVFSSDGLVEAPALGGGTWPEHLHPPEKAGELFGFARLAAAAAHWARRGHTGEHVAAGIWRDLTAWCGEESHHDDVTLVVLRVPDRQHTP